MFNKLANEKSLEYLAESAGTAPQKNINPLVKDLLEEKGYLTKTLIPKQLDLSTIDSYERIISFGCIVKSALPDCVLKKFEEWHIDDPSMFPDKTDDIFLQIQEKVHALLNSLSSNSLQYRRHKQ